MRSRKLSPSLLLLVLTFSWVLACSPKINQPYSEKLLSPDPVDPAPSPTLFIIPSSKALAIHNSFTFSATGGIPPYRYSIATGAGTIDINSGLYIAPGFSSTATIRVTDANQNSSEASVTINAALSISPTTLTLVAGTAGVFSATGGVNPYTFSVFSGGGTIEPTSGLYTAPSSAGNATIRVLDSIGNHSDASVVIEAPGLGTQTFTYTGSDQNFVVPAGCTSLTVKMWGGGGGGSGANRIAGSGGGGGYSLATLLTTPSETLTLRVGGGGGASTTTAGGLGGWPNGGNGASAAFPGGGGGAFSAVFRGSTPIVIAGGGGGGGSHSSGGAGGGRNGKAGERTSCGGAGGPPGLQSSGPTGTSAGGNANTTVTWGAGGGGGGHFGGGSGTFYGGCGSGAGGGSGRVPSNGTSIPGHGITPGNANDPDRGTAGTGGTGSTPGQPGLIKVWCPSERVLLQSNVGDDKSK